MGCATHKPLWQAPDLKDTQKLFVIFLLERRSLRPTEEQEQSANSPKEGSPGFKKSFWFPYSSLQRGTVFSPHNSWVSFAAATSHTVRMKRRAVLVLPLTAHLVENTFHQLKKMTRGRGNTFCVKKSAKIIGKSPRIDDLWSVCEALGSTENL